jgi:hypothetical protein
MNRKTTLILISVFALLGLYALWFQSSKQSAASATATPAPSLVVWTTTADQISGIQISELATGKKVVLNKGADGQWNVLEPEAKPADSLGISALTYYLASLTFSSQITAATDLAQFGLVTPAYTLQVTLADGTQLKAAIGDRIPALSGYYVLREGETTPLVVSEYSLQSFLDMLANPPYFVPTPTPLPSPSVSISPTVSSP